MFRYMIVELYSIESYNCGALEWVQHTTEELYSVETNNSGGVDWV